MNKDQILALMMRRRQPAGDISLFSVSDLMADALAGISDRLTEDELYLFIGIGAAIYGYSSRQLGEEGEEGDEAMPEDENGLFEDPLYPPTSRRRH